jgi:ABC-type transport system involved in cytochrome c biogenesis permease subunit
MLGEALFVIAFASSIMYLIQEKNLKSKRFTELYYRLPSLGKLEEMAGFSIMSGFPLITVGILIGFFWAAHMWGGNWYFDPKIIITTISWLVYAVLFYLKATKKTEGKRFVIFVMICFFFVVVSFALTFSFDSIHSINRKFGVN